MTQIGPGVKGIQPDFRRDRFLLVPHETDRVTLRGHLRIDLEAHVLQILKGHGLLDIVIQRAQAGALRRLQEFERNARLPKLWLARVNLNIPAEREPERTDYAAC